MVRLNSFTIFKQKHNKFSKQFLYFLRNSHMKKVFSVGLRKRISNFWGQKLIFFNLYRFKEFFLFSNLNFVNNQKNMENFFEILILTFIFLFRDKAALAKLFGYLFCLQIKKVGLINFIEKVFLSQVVGSYFSFFRFRIVNLLQQTRHYFIKKKLNV